MTGRWSKRRTSGWLVAAAVAGYLGACSSQPKSLASLDRSSAEWDATVDRAIPDAARAARVKALGSKLAELQRTMATDLGALNEQAVALNADYAATPEQTRKLGEAYVDRRRAAFVRYRDLVFEMRREVSAAEWKAIAK